MQHELGSYIVLRTSNDNRWMPQAEQFLVVSIEERLLAWREVDRAATAAEHAFPKGESMVDSPETQERPIRATQLRKEADRQFGQLLRAVRLSDSK